MIFLLHPQGVGAGGDIANGVGAGGAAPGAYGGFALQQRYGYLFGGIAVAGYRAAYRHAGGLFLDGDGGGGGGEGDRLQVGVHDIQARYGNRGDSIHGGILQHTES